MVRRDADEHLPAPHFMASEFEPQNTTPLPIPPTPAAPPRYIPFLFHYFTIITNHANARPPAASACAFHPTQRTKRTHGHPTRRSAIPLPSSSPPTVHSYACCTHPPYTHRSPIQHPIPSISTDVGAAVQEAPRCWPRFPVPTPAHPLAHTHPMLPSILFPLAFG